MAATAVATALFLLLLTAWQAASGSCSSGTEPSAAAAACTATRPATAALVPFCSVPESISAEAQKVLETRRVNPGSSLRGQPAAVVLKFQQDYDAATQPFSQAAVQQHLQDVTSAVIAGVKVYTATPKGFNSSKSSSSSSRLLVYLHGGAYVKGSCQHLWQVTALTAKFASVRVMCVEYRLAPQHPFPAALDDAVGVYRALVTGTATAGSSSSSSSQQAQGQQSYHARSVGLIGDSAGGGLILALLQRLAQEKLALPGAVALLAPWCDLRRAGDTLTTLTAIDPVLQYDLNLAGPALDYAGSGGGDEDSDDGVSRLSDPLVSPVLAEYGNGRPFPPTLIQVGLRDSLLSSNVVLYRKMVAGGLKDVVLSPWEGMWHVFQANLQVPEAQQAAQELAQWFTQHLQ